MTNKELILKFYDEVFNNWDLSHCEGRQGRLSGVRREVPGHEAPYGDLQGDLRGGYCGGIFQMYHGGERHGQQGV